MNNITEAELAELEVKYNDEKCYGPDCCNGGPLDNDKHYGSCGCANDTENVVDMANALPRLIAEIRRLRGLVETACCIGRLGVDSYGDFVSRTNEFGDTDYKASECPELLEFLDPVDIDAPRTVKPEPPATRFLLESEGKIIGRIVEANPND